MDKTIRYVPHSPIMREIHKSPARFRVLNIGRRGGKTQFDSAEAWEMSNDVFIKKKRRSRGWIVAPTYSHVEEVKRGMRENIGDIIVKEVQSPIPKMILLGGHEVEFKSTHKKDANLRGAGLDWAIMDEDALNSPDAWEYGIRPAIADKQGRAIFTSTPRGRNHFFEKYVKGQDPKEIEWASWQLPTLVNPYFPKEEWEALKRSTPLHIFKQEYEAEFMDDSSLVFRNISSCILGELEDSISTEEYIMGVDLAKTVDFTVILVMKKSTRHIVYFERFNQLEWKYQKERIKYVSKKYNNARINIDSTGVGDPIYNDLLDDGVNIQGIKFNNTNKSDMVQLAVLCVDLQKISYPEIPELINELKSFTYERLPSGKIRYTAPEGLHDDIVMALCLLVLHIKYEIYAEQMRPEENKSTEVKDKIKQAMVMQLQNGLKGITNKKTPRQELMSI